MRGNKGERRVGSEEEETVRKEGRGREKKRRIDK